jgi:hypothetical protein
LRILTRNGLVFAPNIVFFPSFRARAIFRFRSTAKIGFKERRFARRFRDFATEIAPKRPLQSGVRRLSTFETSGATAKPSKSLVSRNLGNPGSVFRSKAEED